MALAIIQFLAARNVADDDEEASRRREKAISSKTLARRARKLMQIMAFLLPIYLRVCIYMKAPLGAGFPRERERERDELHSVYCRAPTRLTLARARAPAITRT